MDGSTTLTHRSRHCLPLWVEMAEAMRDHFLGPWRVTWVRRAASWAGVHERDDSGGLLVLLPFSGDDNSGIVVDMFDSRFISSLFKVLIEYLLQDPYDVFLKLRISFDARHHHQYSTSSLLCYLESNNATILSAAVETYAFNHERLSSNAK